MYTVEFSNFSNPQFFETPNHSNQNSFPLDLISANGTFDFFEPISISQGGSKSRDPTVVV